MPWYFGCKPFAVFIYKYLCRGGVLDGVPGFVICVNAALLYYFVFTILWDRQRGLPEYRLERYLPGDGRDDNRMTMSGIKDSV
jgi:hypothetical protein